MSGFISVVPNEDGARITQWDQGRYVGVPECTRVDFAMRGARQCLSMLPQDDGDGLVAQIPNQLLTHDGELRIWAMSEERAIAFAAYPVHPKPRPPDYLEDPTGTVRVYEMIEELDERVTALEDAERAGFDITRLELALEETGKLLLIDTRG